MQMVLRLTHGKNLLSEQGSCDKNKSINPANPPPIAIGADDYWEHEKFDVNDTSNFEKSIVSMD